MHPQPQRIANAAHPQEDGVVNLAQTQQLQNLLSLRRRATRARDVISPVAGKPTGLRARYTANTCYLGVNLVETLDAHHKQELVLRLAVEATAGLGLALQADDFLLLHTHARRNKS
eukprot:353273-Chlamydomonas_euryale.AAC.16